MHGGTDPHYSLVNLLGVLEPSLGLDLIDPRSGLYCDYVDPFIILGEWQRANVEQDKEHVTSLSLYNNITWMLTPIHHRAPAPLCLAAVTVSSYQAVANLSTEAQRMHL